MACIPATLNISVCNGTLKPFILIGIRAVFRVTVVSFPILGVDFLIANHLLVDIAGNRLIEATTGNAFHLMGSTANQLNQWCCRQGHQLHCQLSTGRDWDP